MRTRVLAAFVSFMIVASYSAPASAEKLCIKTSVNRKSLRATTVSAIASICPAGYTAIADINFFSGPKGIYLCRRYTSPEWLTAQFETSKYSQVVAV